MTTSSNQHSNCNCGSEKFGGTDLYKFGEQLGDVLRGLLGVKSTMITGGPSGPKYLIVDATETSSGVTVSLDAEFDVTQPLSNLTSDAGFSGTLLFASGTQFPVRVVIAQKYASALSLVPVSGKANTFQIFAGQDPQPLNAPHIITIDERAVSGTQVERITGQVVDPKSKLRVNFTVTHDPAPVVVAGIVAGIAALICSAIVLTEAIIDNCTTQGKEQCGEGKVKKITVKRSYGFSWNAGSPQIGCGQDCEIECKD